MKKRDKGILTVEASIVLTLCTLFILFLFSFARVYRAQSLVSHAVLQSSDSIALESYLREATFYGSEADVLELAERLTGSSTISADSFTSLRSADVPKAAKEKFIYAISNSESNADKKLKALGVKNGLAGIDFSSSRIDLGNDDVIVYVSYTIEMQYPVFGFNEITVTKAAKSKTFGDILFGIETIAENPIMGSATGGGNYKHGTQVQISATPNYGYKFVKWDDGSTANPRVVTVTGAKTYVAIFEASEFGVNVVATPSEGGTVSGNGVYKYLNSATIKATPKAGYHFVNWSIFKHKDNVTNVVNNATSQFVVDQTYTCTAKFDLNTYSVSVKTEGAGSGKASIVYNGKNSYSISAKYKSGFKLSAPSISGYRFVGWKESGGGIFSASQNVSMNIPAKNVTYVACYESLIKTVKFYGYNNVHYATRTVYSGHSLGNNMPGDPKTVGVVFNGWSNGFSRYTTVNSDMNVYSHWGTCSSHRPGDCGDVHYITPFRLSSHSIPAKTITCTCIVCADCGVFLKYSGSRWIPSSGKKWKGVDVLMSPSAWCLTHYGGSCASYKNSNSAGTYRVH